MESSLLHALYPSPAKIDLLRINFSYILDCSTSLKTANTCWTATLQSISKSSKSWFIVSVNRPALVPCIFWDPSQIMVLSIFLRRHIVQWFMRAFTVIFWQPFFRDFPHFIQRSEQIKIEYFRTVCPVKALNESVLRRLTRLDKFQFYCMFLCPFSQRQRDKFRAVIHAKHGRITSSVETCLEL